MLAVLFSLSYPVLAQSQSSSIVSQHGREFWRAIAKNQYAVPEGQQVFPLLRELSGYLGAIDPELRDDLAYTIIEAWIKHQPQLTSDELGSLLDEWQANLRIGIGESGNDGVLKRSYSALCLSSLAERELKTPFLGEARYRILLASALAYLRDERDLRGFDPKLGWIHATAHTADLLAAVARNPLFRREDQEPLLEAIAGRLSSAHQIFTFGEQDRLALAVARIILRKDFDATGFNAWIAAMDTADQRTWKDSPPNLAILQTFENDTYMLRGLAGYLAMSPPSPAVTGAQNGVLKLLQER